MRTGNLKATAFNSKFIQYKLFRTRSTISHENLSIEDGETMGLTDSNGGIQRTLPAARVEKTSIEIWTGFQKAGRIRSATVNLRIEYCYDTMIVRSSQARPPKQPKK